MPDFIVILNNVTLDHEHSAVVNVRDVSRLILFQSRVITIYDNSLIGLGSVNVTLVKHIFYSKEFELRNVPSYLSMFQGSGTSQ